MVKHNNVVPNGHFHKDWQRLVKTWFDQPARKKQRRLARAAKAAKVAPRPLQMLRPAVHCPTVKYNSKVRLGRGFTLEELKAAGISRKVARTVGICVDHRRTNRSVEHMEANVLRLKEYKAKLVIFPRRSNQQPKKGDSSAAETAAATQHAGVIQPLAKAAQGEVEYAAVSDEMKGTNAYATLRLARTDKKQKGTRLRMKKEREEAEK